MLFPPFPWSLYTVKIVSTVASDARDPPQREDLSSATGRRELRGILVMSLGQRPGSFHCSSQHRICIFSWRCLQLFHLLFYFSSQMQICVCYPFLSMFLQNKVLHQHSPVQKIIPSPINTTTEKIHVLTPENFPYLESILSVKIDRKMKVTIAFNALAQPFSVEGAWKLKMSNLSQSSLFTWQEQSLPPICSAIWTTCRGHLKVLGRWLQY